MKILFTRKAHDKINYWVQKSEVEISGFGLVKYDKPSLTFIVTDAFLLEQTCGAAHTDIEAQSLSKLMFKTKDAENQRLKLWWHSHVNMSAFWSGTDIATIKELGGQGWITATVFNKKGENKSAVCWKTESEIGSSLSINDDVKTEIENTITPELQAALDLEYTENFKIQTFTHKAYDDSWRGESRFNQGYLPQYRNESSQWDSFTKPRASGGVDVDSNLTKDQKKSKKQFFRKGYFGYGAVAEAKVLNLSPEAYVNKLLFGDSKDYEEIEHALMLSESTGVLT